VNALRELGPRAPLNPTEPFSAFTLGHLIDIMSSLLFSPFRLFHFQQIARLFMGFSLSILQRACKCPRQQVYLQGTPTLLTPINSLERVQIKHHRVETRPHHLLRMIAFSKRQTI